MVTDEQGTSKGFTAEYQSVYLDGGWTLGNNSCSIYQAFNTDPKLSVYLAYNLLCTCLSISFKRFKR